MDGDSENKYITPTFIFNTILDADSSKEMVNSSDSELSEANDSADEDEEDGIEEQFVNIDSENEKSEEEDVDFEEVTVSSFLFGKDKVTKWNITKPKQNVKPRAQNIDYCLRGVKGGAKNAKSALECWKTFFTDEMLAIIVENTNKCIEIKRKEFLRERDCKCTDIVEIKAFFGLLYMAGYYKNSKLNTEELWSTDGSGVELFRIVMSRNRFHLLLSCLRFDNKNTRQERKAQDKLAPLREVFDIFVNKCKTNYSVGQNVTIDEMLTKFKGKCGFRQYVPNKLGKYGIKIFSLIDASVFYTMNLEIYVGKQPEGPFQQECTSREVVKRLCQPIFGSGRNVTGTNWFTSYDVANDLFLEKITYVGTIKNKKEIPSSFVTTQGREEYSSKFGFQKNMTLVSYIPKKSKNIILLSTMHNDDSIDESSGIENKPEIVTFFNNTKSSVDTIEKMCASYSVAKNTNRWPMAVFYTLLNVGAINAHILYKANNNSALNNRRRFIKTLALELVGDQLKRRAQLQSLSKDFRQKILELSNNVSKENEQNEVGTSLGTKRPSNETEKTGLGRKRCKFCDRKKNRMTKYKCFKCENHVCLEHANYLCNNCK